MERRSSRPPEAERLAARGLLGGVAALAIVAAIAGGIIFELRDHPLPPTDVTPSATTTWPAPSASSAPSSAAPAIASASAAPESPPDEVVELAAAERHTCARYASGRVTCWGQWAEEPSDLEDPIRSKQWGPRPLTGVADAIAIAAGGDSTCVIHRDRTPECWGEARPSAKNAGWRDVESIAVGYFRSLCARFHDGRVACVGDTKLPRDAEHFVMGLDHVAAISLGYEHGCALGDDGKVRCWGSNTSGQIGKPGVDRSDAPVVVAGISDAVAIAAGRAHTCALKKDGSVACWGAGTNGKPGSVSKRPVAIPDLKEVVGIGAGGDDTCALERSGDIVCWGAAGKGQLGTGALDDTSPRDKKRSAVSNGVSLAVGPLHACALVATGQVSCWGDDHVGALGFPGHATCHETSCATTPDFVRGL